MTLGKFACIGALGVLLSGCGAGVNAGEAVRPDAPSASDAIEDTVACTAGERTYAEPLVVDWSTSSRTDLEVAMQQGIAIVRFDCEQLRLVNGCRLPANYAFAGVSLKEELIRMDNADEVQANLPVSGVKISAGMNAASALDLALVMIGKRTTTLSEADTSMLEGSCDGATHFVRAATVGAFAMDRSSSGQVRAAADLFGAGADASSRSGRNNVTRDGDRDACKSGQPTDETAPVGCGASLRLELVPLKQAPQPKQGGARPKKPQSPKAPSGAGSQRAADCPVDTVWKENKCVHASADERLCFRGNLPACNRLCDNGDGWACMTEGTHLLERASMAAKSKGEKIEEIDPEIFKAFNRGCKLRHEGACATSAFYRIARPPSDLSGTAQRTEASCQRGGAESCAIAALIYEPGTGLRSKEGVTAPAESMSTYVSLTQRACDLGLANSCSRLARRLLRDGQQKARALSLLKRTCEGGYGWACHDWAHQLDEAGRPATAAHARALSCMHGEVGWDCERAARAFIEAPDVPRDPDRANRVARRGCDMNDERSCAFLFEHGHDADRRYALQRSCDPTRADRHPRSLCREAAEDNLKRAVELDRDSCNQGDALACERHATRQLAMACSRMGSHSDSCTTLRARDPASYRQVLVRECLETRDRIRKGMVVLSPPGQNGAQPRVPWCDEAAEEGLARP